MNAVTWHRTSILLLTLPLLAACGEDTPLPQAPSGAAAAPAAYSAAKSPPFTVTGTAIHYFSTAIVHSQVPNGSGMVQLSTDIIQLTGDLNGFVLYHPTSTFDFAAGTLVNTGTQIFSGSVAGSAPVILHDDSFRFEVDLATGATTGEVHLGRSSDAPHRGSWFECDLIVTGTGVTPEGDNLSDYTGTCTSYGASS